MWAMMGGSVIVAENSKQTIVREAKEELDINIDINKLEFITKFRVDSLIVETYFYWLQGVNDYGRTRPRITKNIW